MCGITGFFDVERRLNDEASAALLSKMTGSLSHRGPDDEGTFYDSQFGIALGHRRLSIVDLSADGHQPMASSDGRYVLVFNGEVYNHFELRLQLEGCGLSFRGHSDTEVMLAAIEQWGIEDALPRFIGMFAFALWDRLNHSLTLVRDRLGVKPLYFGWVGSIFVFGSELKPLTALPDFNKCVNRDALCLFLRYNYIPAPYSIYKGIYKLRPGTSLHVDPKLAMTPVEAEAMAAHTHIYWSARDAAELGLRDPIALPDTEVIRDLDGLLRDSVALRMEADVPLGAFLSGGVDSSLVVALMQQQSTKPVQTFSIGFEHADFDEAQQARVVASHLGTEHHELYVSARDALDVVPLLPAMFDEPFADSSQIPTYLVSKLARGTVTVSLSGDGGDELFAGYNRYFFGSSLRRHLDRVPLSVRRGLAAGLGAGDWFGRALTLATPHLPESLRLKDPKGKARKLINALGAANADERYRLLVSQWTNPESVVIGGSEPPIALDDPAWKMGSGNPVERMMFSDLVTYLPDDILTKVDRASMAVGLEARVPLLDHRLVEFAWRVPMHQKVRDGQGKWLLRQVLYQYVPKNLIERPKQGFGGPVHEWLRGPLRDWAESLLSEDRLTREGYFDPKAIRTLWVNHLMGRVDEPHRLWGVLMFQAWLENANLAH